MTNINLIVAMAANRVIGRDNRMPWHLPADLAWFKSTTMKHPIIMGRKTHEAIGRSLPGRRNLVITHNADYRAEGCEIYHSLDAALASCTAGAEVFVIGGGALYAEALPRAHCIYLTEVDAAPDGDTFFPEVDSHEWRQRVVETHAADAQNAHAMKFIVMERVTPD